MKANFSPSFFSYSSGCSLLLRLLLSYADYHKCFEHEYVIYHHLLLQNSAKL